MIQKDGKMIRYTAEELRKLHPERLDQLADELESGSWRKGEGRLATLRDGMWYMCCMGVASELAVHNGLSSVRVMVMDAADGCKKKAYGAGQTGTLCEAVGAWYGFKEQNPYLPLPDGKFTTMGSWNDSGPDGTGPEDDFTTIAAGVRRLAQMAREARGAEAGT